MADRETATGIDLSACDREPIHLIGGIQPQGALVAAEETTRRITHASANAGAVLGREARAMVGQGLDALLSADDLAEILARDLTPTRPHILRPVLVALPGPGDGRRLECVAHRHAGHLVLEFFPLDETPAEVWEEEALRQRIIADLVRPETLDDLAALGAEIVRGVIGFDRVMIYRFAADGHGEVIAESTDRADSFLGQHYPASDIPEPARRHFVLNAVRVIADIEADPVPILGTPAEEAPATVDLTFSKLRAVPRVHVEYLANMGVRASCSISLVTNETLWGLIACHHYAPARVSSSRIRFLELIGGTLSALLQGIENRMVLRRSIDAEKTAFDMEREGRAGLALEGLLDRWAEAVMALTGSQGAVLVRGGSETAHHGRVPDPSLDYAPLSASLVEGIAVCDRLSAMVAMTDAQREAAAGAAYIELSEDGADFLVLLREHHEHTIPWAGRPGKFEVREADGTLRLSPRGSFALWREERVGYSRPYDATDREVLRILRRALFALNSLERERAAVEAREAAEAEEERLRLALLDAARRTSMGELASALAHELNQPLAAVTNYVNACRRELQNYGMALPDTVDEIMGEAVAEASRAADLLRRLRDFIAGGEIEAEETDLDTAIRQGVELAMLAREGAGPDVTFDLAPDLPPVWADPVQVAQVVLNLSMNAIAAMEGRNRRELTVTTRAAGGEARVAVRDTGVGIPPDRRAQMFEPFHASTTRGMGIGLSLCRSIVEAHGGRIWHEDPGDGAVFVFSLPLAGRHG